MLIPIRMRRRRIISGRIRRLKPKTACMRCMHQKTDYARYARTQLRKRLHTMHTETRIGVSVGLRGCKCMQLRMHTKCIQNAYKHKKRGFFLLLLFILSVFYLLLPVFQTIIFCCSRLQAFTDPQTSLPVLLDHSRLPSHTTCMRCMHQKTDYARYARTQLRN